MTTKPTAIGYLRKDISGFSQMWDETQMRSLAKRLGYNLTKTVTFGPETDHPLTRLLNVVRHLAVDAVITPALNHLDGQIPDELKTAAIEVVTVNPEHTYARWPLPV
ncbi:hypothetical protein ACQPZ2_30400 [Nocardia pseudovaccinii]|uniref:hypothetical protein n=1 Tax=Nocardia pseudovaccinii TaxID=189540 RepID=UPI003D8A67E1